MNISASTASRNMFSKGHVHKHPLWRIKTVVLGFLTNKNNHSVIRATAGGHVQPNKQGFVHLDLPMKDHRGAWKSGEGQGSQGKEEIWTSGPRTWSQLLFYLTQLRPWTKAQLLWVSVSAYWKDWSNFDNSIKHFKQMIDIVNNVWEIDSPPLFFFLEIINVAH